MRNVPVVWLQLLADRGVLSGMKTFCLIVLKIALVAVVMWWVLHHAPLILAPLAGAVFTLIGIGVAILVALTVGATLGLSLLMVLGVVACALAAAMAPVWLPLLLIVGVIMLLRPRPTRST